ncbi:MAG: phosphoribosylformylglycinamidine synthase subunit PurQ, partial [Gemmatimonadaceae bacterium]|nr:phosphoribosylformylglycinamidine synthase subunit PurQ [Gemmatimonadaceae bacterium]
MKFGIVSFPGSNCDDDAVYAATETLGQPAVKLWHKSHDLEGSDVIILPGGFSYGDYLRAGAIARFSPIMREVAAHAQRGGPVIGICNGFQIACEAGLLPGALMRNAGLKFLSMPVTIRVENTDTRWTSQCTAGQCLTMPIAHGEGRYTVDDETLRRVEGEGLVVFRYV